MGERTVKASVYESAVKGRADFRDAYRREREKSQRSDYPTSEQWDAIWRDIQGSAELARARRRLSIHEFRLLLSMFTRHVCKEPDKEAADD